MADSPASGSDGPVGVTIKANGSTIPDSYEVIAVRTRAEANRIPEAVIALLDGDVAAGDFPAADSNHFKPGAEIEIAAGYGSAAHQRIFKGVVTGLRLRLTGEQSRLEVSCRDKAFSLALERRNRVYADGTDADAIKKIVSDAGLQADIASTSETHPALVQSRCTDWDFLLARAEACGLMVTVAEGKVTAKAPDDAAAAKLTVTYGEDLIDLDAQLSAREQCAAFDLEAWDPKAVETVSANESAESGAKLGNLSASGLAEVGGAAADATALSAAVSQSMLQTAAKARRDRAALARMRARLTYQGSAKAGLGDVVELARVGDRFGGKGVVTAVGHRIENGQWLTEAAFGLPRPWRAETPEGLAAPAAGAMTAPVAGLQIGTVVKLSDDPDGLHRLTVSLPTVAGDSQVLARYAAPYASGDAGLMLLPEIGDEVVVGFLDDDPGQAVVLGSLHNGKSAPPQAVSDDKNTVKILRSREDLRLTFDEEKKSITLSTPGGATVTLSDEESSITAEDQSGNTLSMTKAGVTLDSKAALTLKAAQAVTISAGAAVTVSGANVEITGDMSAKMSGNASAELSSAGQTTISGALVNIN